MPAERSQRIEQLYHAARERDPGQRAAFLQQACAEDEALRWEVESLLAEDAGVEKFLERPVLEAVTKVFSEDLGESWIGRTLGSYRILSFLGKGGMGEVYCAQDTKLRREVALKVLPAAFAHDPERLARFRREAQLLASLNHNNIGGIYGFEQSGNVNFLVLELVLGETLGERVVASGPLPVEEALCIANQIAEAMEGAHEKGIIHRDLKPANIKVTPEGKVKVLDFGLARAFGGNETTSDLSESPNLTAATLEGMILGTAAYMSPEQARGKKIDKRTDIWAFGCVLYELLTGKQAFEGETVTETLAAVLKAEPGWTLLPATTPPSIRTLLRRCLQKELTRRLRDATDVRIEIQDALSAPQGAPALAALDPKRPLWRRAIPWTAGLLAGAIIAGLVVWNLRPAPAPRPVSRTVVPLAPGEQLVPTGRALALSPDGMQLAYVARDGAGTKRLYVRAMDSIESRPLTGIEDVEGPFFSPDSKWVGFFASGKLKKVPVGGGAAVTLCDAGNFPFGASWGPNDSIVFSLGGRESLPLWQVPAAGGAPHQLIAPNERVGWVFPEVLPGGKSILFTIATINGNPDDWEIAVQRLDTGERRVLIRGGAYARYVSTGRLVYYRAGTLMAVPFDLTRLEVTGPPAPILQGVMSGASVGAQFSFSDPGASVGAQFSFSDSGSLIYVSGVSEGGRDRTLVWVDRKGVAQPLPAPPRSYLNPRVSPDGRLVAVTVVEPNRSDVWIYDLSRDALTRMTFEGASFPQWTPDGKRVLFSSIRDGIPSLSWKVADSSGPEELLITGRSRTGSASFTPEGRTLLYAESDPKTRNDIWVVPLEGERKPRPFLQTPFDERTGQFSPDGHWVAYLSDESGRNEVFVQPFPSPGGKWQISTGGAAELWWSPKGNELFYRTGLQREKMMVVDVQTQPTFTASKPRLLFTTPYDGGVGGGASGVLAAYSVTPDGQRFLMLKAAEQPAVGLNQINVVLNWFEDLKRRVSSGQ